MTTATGHPYTPIPAAFTDAATADEPASGSTIADELALYAVHLQAENKARATVSLWTGAARQLHTYLADHGMPTDVRAIRREHLESWLASLLAAGAKPATVNNRYRSVQPLFGWLREEGLISDNPMANMKAPKVPDDEAAFPPDEHVERLLEHTAKDKSFEGIRDRAMLEMLVGSGLRRAELAGMTMGSLDIAKRSVTVRRKGGKTETTYVPAKALTALGRYERARRMHPRAASPAYWLGKKGPITGNGVYQIVEKRAAAAGLPHITVHSLRHYWAHTGKAAGVPDEVLRVLGGWSKNSRMLGRYAASAARERAMQLAAAMDGVEL